MINGKLTFDIINVSIDDNVCVFVDQSSVEMEGTFNLYQLESLFEKNNNNIIDIARDLNFEDHHATVTIKVWEDSDDNQTWIDWEIIKDDED